MRQVRKAFSRTLKDSEIYQLNHGTLPKQGNAFVLSEKTAALIQKGLEYEKLLTGLLTLPLSRYPLFGILPLKKNESLLTRNLEMLCLWWIIRDAELRGNLLTFKKDGMGLDLGAIAKGYIADEIKVFLLEKGVKSATINLGGNVLCVGEKPEGVPFKIGIQKPFADRSETIAVMEITDKSVVSSGIL